MVENNKVVEEESDYIYFKNIPRGYRFSPTDEELVLHYLMNRDLNRPLPRNRIREVNFYERHPQEFAEMYKLDEKIESEWYFFTGRERKYPKGQRPSRKAGDGHWKPTGTEKSIEIEGVRVATRKSLDYYQGNPNHNPVRTLWKMHEYVLELPNSLPSTSPDHDMQLNKWVLCKLYTKKTGNSNNEAGESSNSSKTQNEEISSNSNNNQELDNSLILIPNHDQAQAMNDFLIQNQVHGFAENDDHLLGLANPFTPNPNINNGASIFNNGLMQVEADLHNIFGSYGDDEGMQMSTVLPPLPPSMDEVMNTTLQNLENHHSVTMPKRRKYPAS